MFKYEFYNLYIPEVYKIFTKHKIKLSHKILLEIIQGVNHSNYLILHMLLDSILVKKHLYDDNIDIDIDIKQYSMKNFIIHTIINDLKNAKNYCYQNFRKQSEDYYSQIFEEVNKYTPPHLSCVESILNYTSTLKKENDQNILNILAAQLYQHINLKEFFEPILDLQLRYTHFKSINNKSNHAEKFK